MSKSYRIRTTPGQENNGFINVNVDLNQNYDQLEILSLKISQKDDYQNFCSDRDWETIVLLTWCCPNSE